MKINGTEFCPTAARSVTGLFKQRRKQMTMRHARKQFRFTTVWTTATHKSATYTATTHKYRTQMVKKGVGK